MSKPILEHSEDRIGCVWSPDDHDQIVRAVRKIEQLAEVLIARARMPKPEDDRKARAGDNR